MRVDDANYTLEKVDSWMGRAYLESISEEFEK